jgi:DNA-directed RNA polymerase subunit RPC12/RpoP
LFSCEIFSKRRRKYGAPIRKRMSNKEILIGYTFFRPEKVKRYTGADTLYSTRKGKSYILLHVDSLQKEKDMLTIVTNNRHIIKKYDKPFKTNSDRAIMNTKYRISKYLTSVFCGLPIDIETRNKYFLRIRQLLLDKLVVIEARLKKQEKNRQTTTYIKFSHGRRTWYLGFYIPCSFCSNACAYVMSRNRKVCQNCRSKVIVTPSPPPQNAFKNFSQVKQVINKRVGVSYTKKVSVNSADGRYVIAYSNLNVNRQFKTLKEQEKYKKRFKNSLKNNKNKWKITDNGIESKMLSSKHKLMRRSEILKKHHISEREMEFLMDQVTSKVGYNMLKDDIFINHSFDAEHFLELRKKKEASFEQNDNTMAEQSTSASLSARVDNITSNLQALEIGEQDKVAPWQEILNKTVPVTKAEFHRGLNSVRDTTTLTTYCNGVRKGRRGRFVTHDYIINQCSIRAKKIAQGRWY